MHMHHGLGFDTTLQYPSNTNWSTVTKTTKDHKDLFQKPLVNPVKSTSRQ